MFLKLSGVSVYLCSWFSIIIIPPGHHQHRLHRGGEPDGPGLLQHDVQPHADDVPEPLPDQQLLPDGRRGRLPHVQPVPLPLLLR